MFSHKTEQFILEAIARHIKFVFTASGSSQAIINQGIIQGLVSAYIGQDCGTIFDAQHLSCLIGRELVEENGKFHFAPLGKLDYSMRINCAAIQDPSDGRVWTGKRHGDCMQTIRQATGVKCVGGDYPQGFVTMSGEFVSRREAARRALASGQLRPQDVDGDQLYSEDLY